MGITIGSQVGVYEAGEPEKGAVSVETSPENPLPPDAPSTDPGGVIVEGPLGPLVVTDPTEEKVQQAIDAQHETQDVTVVTGDGEGPEFTEENPVEADVPQVEQTISEDDQVVEEKVEPKAEEEPEEPLYDPAEHSVPAVMKHLEGVDEAERERILAAERTGKKRTGILGS